MIKVSVTNAPGSEAWVLSIDMARRGDRGHYECQVPIFELTIPKWVLLREILFVRFASKAEFEKLMDALFGRGALTILFSLSIIFFKSKTMTWMLRLFYWGINQYFHLFEVLAVSWTNWKSDIYWWGILLSEQWDRSIFYDCYTRGTLAHWVLFKFVFVSLSLFSFLYAYL